MTRQLLFLIFLLMTIPAALPAQKKEPVAFWIDGHAVGVGDVETAFRKGLSEGEKIDKKALDDFLQSYINFRLNAIEGKARQLDTTARFRRDYISYRIKIKPQYIERDTQDLFLREIYDRGRQDVQVNHVLLPFDKDTVYPSDTLQLYNTALALRNKILKDGFMQTGYIDNTKNVNPVADIESINGHLGWITPFMLSEPVEEAAYKLPVGEISMPVRSERGMHIIQVLARRPALGVYDIDCVPISFPSLHPTQAQKDSVYKVALETKEHLQSPEDFDELCKAYIGMFKKEEKATCSLGMIKMSAGYLAPSLISAAFEMKDIGQISGPIETENGYCFIRLNAKAKNPSFSKMREWLMDRVLKSDRVNKYAIVDTEKAAKQHNVKIDEQSYARISKIAETLLPTDTLFATHIKGLDDKLFVIDGKRSYRVGDFAAYLAAKAYEKHIPNDAPPVVMAAYEPRYSLSTDQLKKSFADYCMLTLMDYADSTMETRIPQFGKALKDYSDEVLAFDVVNDNVWNKAIADIAGLQNTFEKNKSHYNSWSEPHYKGFVFYCKGKTVMQNAKQQVAGLKKTEDVIAALRLTVNKDSANVLVEPGTWAKGDNAHIDYLAGWGGKTPKPKGGYPDSFIQGRMIDKPVDYTDVRGAVENDYQELLQKEWNAYLRGKYNVKINKSALKSIK